MVTDQYAQQRAVALLARLHGPVQGRGPVPVARWWLEGYRITRHRRKRQATR